jgi:hypothetical protein
MSAVRRLIRVDYRRHSVYNTGVIQPYGGIIPVPLVYVGVINAGACCKAEEEVPTAAMTAINPVNYLKTSHKVYFNSLFHIFQ